ncbi:RWD domain-containing protein 2A [Euwallacea fornicatus]|uniref:RWD domain-containing protein 2A n=1 Tax=Euwallacea fornicatus TaxID=995702 RepID=UPI00338EF6E9
MSDQNEETRGKNVRENMQVQLDELESLQAMFYNPGEVKLQDIEVFNLIQDYVCGKTMSVPPRLAFTVNVPIDNSKFEMCISLCYEYPFVEPEIVVGNCLLNRKQHVELNKKIGEFLRGLPKGEPCIFTVISWLQDNALDYYKQEKPKITPEKCQEVEEQVRYWIYSHHIYSKTKRKALIDLAKELKISGFVMPGKPGVICVEGDARDVIEWWQTVKSMNWKKIFCKITESNKEDLKGTNFLKFHGFTEQVFENRGPKFNHMDMGEFYKYLEKHNLGYIFKDIFGVEIKTP